MTNSRLASRETLRGRRIAVVHYGEGVERDAGYRPLRAGRLAKALVREGAEVTRVSPSYNQWTATQRPLTWTGSRGDEGNLAIVLTRSYVRTRGRRRALSLLDFNSGVGQFLSDAPPFDVVVSTFPPPGLLTRIVRAAGPGTATIADMRDLWPDAIVRNGRLESYVRPIAGAVGRTLALELSLADAVVGLSQAVLHRAPGAARRLATIPIGFDPYDLDSRGLWPEDDGPLRACFVGSMTQLFDLRSMVLGWKGFVHSRQRDALPCLTIAGHGEQKGLVDEMTRGDRSIAVLGWVLPESVPTHLGRADVGLAPIRRRQGTHIPNKVSEYLGAGLYVLNSLEPMASEPLSQLGLGCRVGGSPQEWSTAFSAAEANLQMLRSSRADRVAVAERNFGSDMTDRMWVDLVSDVVTGVA